MKISTTVGFIVFAFSGFNAAANVNQLPLKVTFNEGWVFSKGDLAVANRNPVWEKISLPHTWNANDPFDDEPGYYRGWGTYKKNFSLTKAPGKKYFLYFEGANQVVRASVNGIRVGEHAGGYTGFCIDISSQILDGDNQIIVEVNNEHDGNIPPLKGDFNFYGGIYRDVYLITTGSLYFDKLNYGSPGVSYDYTFGENGSVSISLKMNVGSNNPKSGFLLTTKLKDRTGNEIFTQTKKYKTTGAIEIKSRVPNVNRWSVDDPYLYVLTSELSDDKGTVSDKVSIPVGFREISFNSKQGFSLNGKPLKLLGVNRHQDFKGLGSAVPNELHVSDLELIKSLGANFLRTAHYPQDPAVLEACDRLGILASMEIPIDHDMTDNETFRSVTKNMMREMIRQHKHHPSLLIWAYMNEMFLGKQLERDEKYINTVVNFAKELNQVAKEEDPGRPTMIANHGDRVIYSRSGLVDIPDIVGWNLYYGWYGQDCNNLGKFLDEFHEDFPGKPVIITEFGAGSDTRVHSFHPERFDFSVEWQSQYYLCYYPQINARKFVNGASVWNMFDFGAEERADAIPHINKKGLCTFDRNPKDAFYVVKSFLNNEPQLKILSSDWKHRVLSSKEKFVLVHVVGNVENAELFLNNESIGKMTLEGNKAIWQLPLMPGPYKIKAQSEALTDQTEFDVQVIGAGISDLSVNLGAGFYLVDPVVKTTWIPDQVYEKGSWGAIGGGIYKPRDRGFGTDHGIMLSGIDPVYQTCRVGIQGFTAETRGGTYDLTFHFSEPQLNPGERIFDVVVNGNTVYSKLDVAGAAGKNSALAFTCEVETYDKINVQFIPLKGEPLLSGIQIRKKW